ncbi:MAG: GntR family transcriptional regulator [Neisseriaceae bacterium]
MNEALPHSLPLSISTHSERVYRALLTSIIRGDLVPGSKIIEQEIARIHGTSRGPLREAINRLEGQKLVVRVPHVGARVASLSTAQLVELYQIRACLEGLACRLAATKITTHKISELFHLLEKHEKNLMANESCMTYDEDYDFHYRIILASENKTLLQLLGVELYQLIRMYRQKCLMASQQRHVAFKEHHQIIEALEKKDGELAELLMKRHIEAAQTKLLGYFSSL